MEKKLFNKGISFEDIAKIMEVTPEEISFIVDKKMYSFINYNIFLVFYFLYI